MWFASMRYILFVCLIWIELMIFQWFVHDFYVWLPPTSRFYCPQMTTCWMISYSRCGCAYYLLRTRSPTEDKRQKKIKIIFKCHRHSRWTKWIQICTTNTELFPVIITFCKDFFFSFFDNKFTIKITLSATNARFLLVFWTKLSSHTIIACKWFPCYCLQWFIVFVFFLSMTLLRCNYQSIHENRVLSIRRLLLMYLHFSLSKLFFPWKPDFREHSHHSIRFRTECKHVRLVIWKSWRMNYEFEGKKINFFLSWMALNIKYDMIFQ